MICFIFVWGSLASKRQEIHRKLLSCCDFSTSKTSSINFEQFFLLKIWIWWYPSLTPKISRQMPDKCPDIYQSAISLSCFFLSMQLLTIHHCLWSQLSKCLLNVTQVFKQVVTMCCADKCCMRCMCRLWCAGAWLCEMHTDVSRGHYWNFVYVLCVYVCTCMCVSMCGCMHACVYTSVHNPYPERDKSNPLPGGAQGSSIDGTLSGCWWTSLSDKVYHSDLSQSKTLSGISKHQGNLKATLLLEGKWADSIHTTEIMSTTHQCLQLISPVPAWKAESIAHHVTSKRLQDYWMHVFINSCTGRT